MQESCFHQIILRFSNHSHASTVVEFPKTEDWQMPMKVDIQTQWDVAFSWDSNPIPWTMVYHNLPVKVYML